MIAEILLPVYSYVCIPLQGTFIFGKDSYSLYCQMLKSFKQ